VRVLCGEDIMTRQRGTVWAGVLLGLLVLAVVGCGDKPGPEKNEQPAVKDELSAAKAVEKLGGQVRMDANRPGKLVRDVDLSDKPITDAQLKELMKELKELDNLEELRLENTQVTDTGLKELKDLKSLLTLALFGTKVTDAGLKEVNKIKSLRWLGLEGTKVTDAGLKELKELQNLKTLRLDYNTKVTDAGLKELKDLKSLKTLFILGTKVTDAGVKELKTARPGITIYH
jgi:hypothetical protein